MQKRVFNSIKNISKKIILQDNKNILRSYIISYITKDEK